MNDGESPHKEKSKDFCLEAKIGIKNSPICREVKMGRISKAFLHLEEWPKEKGLWLNLEMSTWWDRTQRTAPECLTARFFTRGQLCSFPFCGFSSVCLEL